MHENETMAIRTNMIFLEARLLEMHFQCLNTFGCGSNKHDRLQVMHIRIGALLLFNTSAQGKTARAAFSHERHDTGRSE